MNKTAWIALSVFAATIAPAQTTFHGNPSAAQTIPDAWDIFTSSPAVVDGTVHVGNSDSARFMALDAMTGRLWINFDAKAYIDFYRLVSIGAIMSSPVVDRGVVYVGSMDGKLYAIE
jgi:outer membrane protein assembly factor BamB